MRNISARQVLYLQYPSQGRFNMYLHIGSNRNIREKNIIGIFDLDGATLSPVTRNFLSRAEKRGLVEATNEELPKSFVLYCDNQNQTKVCFSQISSVALCGRTEEKADET